jgi:hypothetical protein
MFGINVFLARFGTMGVMSTGLGREEYGSLPRVGPFGLEARGRRVITEVV